MTPATVVTELLLFTIIRTIAFFLTETAIQDINEKTKAALYVISGTPIFQYARGAET